MKYIPYTFPSKIMEFIHRDMNEQLNKMETQGTIIYEPPSIADYYESIPDSKIEEYSSYYHNTLLRTYQLMTNEGLLTPQNNSKGFDQKYQMNGFDPRLNRYGYYDFLVFGFQYMRDKFDETVRPIILNRGSKTKDEDIGSGFVINPHNDFNKDFYFVTAKHCIPNGSKVYIPAFLPKNKPLLPSNIWVPKNKQIDIAVIQFDYCAGIPSQDQLWLGEPHILEEVMTMGFPPIQGFTEPILVSETARVSSFLKSSVGEISGEGKHYWGGHEDHILITARVKGGNSGGPVLNKKGEVVGIITELPKDNDRIDLLGFGVAISSTVLKRVLDVILGIGSEIEIKKLDIQIEEDGFIVN